MSTGADKAGSARTETGSLIAAIANSLNVGPGERFFPSLVEQLARIVGASCAWAGERVAGARARFRTLAAYAGGPLPPGLELELPVPGQPAPDPAAGEWGALRASVPMRDSSGEALGAIALFYRDPPPQPEAIENVLRICSGRAAAELERLRTGEAFRQSEARYREFLAHSQEGVWRWEFDPPVPLHLSEDEVLHRMLRHSRLAEANDALLRINQFPPAAQLLGCRMIDLPYFESRHEMLRQQIRAGFPVRANQFPARTGTGEIVWLENLQIPAVENGMLVSAWGLTRDITQCKLAELEVKQAEERYRALFEAAGEAILVSRDTVMDCNSRALRLFGASREQILGHHPWDFSPEFQPDGIESREVVLQQREALAKGSMHMAFDWQFRRPDGSLFDGHVTLTPVRIAGVPHRLGLIRDISDRKRTERETRKLNAELERMVEQRTEQLENANRELEAFSYSVSHDVRAAIRGIYACSRILLDDYGSRLNGDGARWLEAMRDDSRRLDQVTQGLLELSRLARAPMEPAEVDLGAIARGAARRLAEAEPARSVRLRIEGELLAIGDEPLLRAVMEHLLGNAWKFTRGRTVAVIEAGALDSAEGDRVFFVRDNGVGFDPRRAGRLFNAFERLHPEGEFEGSGIGLATVRRLIHRHGGRVWAEGALEQGATIFFTLPEPRRA